MGLALLQLCLSMLRIDFSLNNDTVHVSWEVPKCEIIGSTGGGIVSHPAWCWCCTSVADIIRIRYKCQSCSHESPWVAP